MQETCYNLIGEFEEVTMARPGGNPDFGTKYGFKTEREEPLKRKIGLRVTEKMYQQLIKTDNYGEFIREAIVEKIERSTKLQEAG